MSDSELYGPTGAITIERLPLIPNPRSIPYREGDLPTMFDILAAVSHQDTDSTISAGEISRAKLDKRYIGLSDNELGNQVPTFINKCLEEIDLYEKISRRDVKERLKALREIASRVKVIFCRSAAGDYYHFFKNDRMKTGNFYSSDKKDSTKHDPASLAADRLRSDQTAILAIVLAGINAEPPWPDEELLLFLSKHILTNDDKDLNALKEKARNAVQNSGIRITYSGRIDEEKAIRTVLRQPGSFIPEECVDILPPKVDNTVDQTKQFKAFLEDLKLENGDIVIEPINIQGIRSRRADKLYEMIPPGISAYTYAMATSDAATLRANEIKGGIYNWLTGQASSDPAPHELI